MQAVAQSQEVACERSCRSSPRYGWGHRSNRPSKRAGWRTEAPAPTHRLPLPTTMSQVVMEGIEVPSLLAHPHLLPLQARGGCRGVRRKASHKIALWNVPRALREWEVNEVSSTTGNRGAPNRKPNHRNPGPSHPAQAEEGQRQGRGRALGMVPCTPGAIVCVKEALHQRARWSQAMVPSSPRMGGNIE